MTADPPIHPWFVSMTMTTNRTLTDHEIAALQARSGLGPSSISQLSEHRYMFSVRSRGEGVIEALAYVRATAMLVLEPTLGAETDGYEVVEASVTRQDEHRGK